MVLNPFDLQEDSRESSCIQENFETARGEYGRILQNSDQRGFWETSEKIHIFWSTVWKPEPGTDFQTYLLSALEEL